MTVNRLSEYDSKQLGIRGFVITRTKARKVA